MSCLSQLEVNEYQLLEGGRADAVNIVLRRIVQFDKTSKWAIYWDRLCLNAEGSWVMEPSPSNRDETYIRNTRFPTAPDALNFWQVGDYANKVLNQLMTEAHARDGV